MERHRQIVLLLHRNPELVAHRTVLHFAPESCLTPTFRAAAETYIGCDLHPKQGEVKINIENIEMEAESVDLIVCNQVLEHVNDRRALQEMFRVLRDRGNAILTTPVIEAWPITYENDDIVTERARMIHFGQEDHLRFYGRDVRDRIRAAGFECTEYVASEPDVSRYGLRRGEVVFVATKVSGS